ncbi:putative MobA-like protein [Belliella baltica DSM 15883]|uniref:Putative MobA-like protein n=1 Tax=Belliella baltica (strain DSM 15883 / CIP 108006 / LMG 21964 / BA134) TaxID=866536 RepID=I3Z7W0_BELBD|nr:nucleotidyltransferase family protein [Belliella baltica]AFL85328.1 putative MobA-like protein [Belliella baltica DSM 15883]
MTNSNYPQTGIIILAAGNSSRLGQAKQLLDFKGEKLLQIAIDIAEDSLSDVNLVVLGAYKEQIKNEIDFQSCEIVTNENWSKGLSSSMKVGLSAMIENYAVDQILIMLSDQPFVTKELLNLMIKTQLESRKGIVACRYGDTLGVPVLYTKKYFEELMQLKEKEGAKKVIFNHLEDCEIIVFERGKIDIDTQEDYDQLLGKKA